jgi:hypothetical protein
MTVTAVGNRIRAAGTSRAGLAAAVLLTSAVGLLEETVNTASVPTHAVVWGGLAMMAYAYGILCLLAAAWGPEHGLGNWRIGPWMLVWWGMAFGLATVTWSKPQVWDAQINVASVLRALWLVMAGTTAWAIGYVVGPGHVTRAWAFRLVSAVQQRYSTQVRSIAAPWLLYGVGAMARAISTITTGRLGYVGDAASAVSTASGYAQVFAILTLCAPLAVATAALQVFRERMPTARITLCVLFLAEIAFAVASADKQNYVVAVLAVAIPFSAARRRLPRAALTSVALVFLIVIIPFTQAYRNAVRTETATLTAGQAVGTAPGILRQTVISYDSIPSVVSSSVGYLLDRNQDINSVAIIMQRTPSQIGFSSPVQLAEAPLAALIPRALWPGKPILATGYQFGQEYYGLPSTVYSSTAITPIGDLYRHGGWIPVLFGMFLLGCGIRLLDDVLNVRNNPHGIYLILLLFPSLVMAEQDWITLLAGVPSAILLWLAATAMTFRRRCVA